MLLVGFIGLPTAVTGHDGTGRPRRKAMRRSSSQRWLRMRGTSWPARASSSTASASSRGAAYSTRSCAFNTFHGWSGAVHWQATAEMPACAASERKALPTAVSALARALEALEALAPDGAAAAALSLDIAADAIRRAAGVACDEWAARLRASRAHRHGARRTENRKQRLWPSGWLRR